MKLSSIGVATALICCLGSLQPSFAESCDSGTFDGAFDGEELLPQNWDCRDRQEFWFTDQGSQIIPYVWFLNLEQADSTAKFADPTNMDIYRYLPQRPTALNLDGLPIGFTKGGTRHNSSYREISREWLGMTCAACHTGQVEYEGRKYLIDGAPTMGDFESLFRDLVAAMKATLVNDEKFLRFATAVIADSQRRNSGGTDDLVKLRRQLEQVTKIRDEWNARNEGTSDYGHARLDAIGAIFNEIAATGLGVPENRTSANAPVSYPFVWDTSQHDKVQWNGSVTNAGPGALGRNVGEVLGVFGALDLNTVRLSRSGHANSVDMKGLGKLEGLMWKLQSPRWQDTRLPDIDVVKAAEGRKDFETYCLSCHADIVREDPARRIMAVMVLVSDPDKPEDSLGTDVTMAKNFLTKTAKARRLTDRFVRYWGVLSRFERFEEGEEDNVSQAKILGYGVIGAITRAFFDDPKETIRALKVGQPDPIKKILDDAEERYMAGEIGKLQIRRFLKEIGQKLRAAAPEPDEPACELASEKPLPCYKARPLNGIWATAPYLHNGLCPHHA